MPIAPIITVDIGFGDAGKGTIVEHLCEMSDKPPTIVRYSGGANCGHNVVRPDGKEFCFSQLGSGSFRSGVKTYLGPKVVFDPLRLWAEATKFAKLTDRRVENVLSNVAVHPDCIIATPWHSAINQLKSLTHSTCGVGLGVAREIEIHKLCVYPINYDILGGSFKHTCICLIDYLYETHKVLIQNSKFAELWESDKINEWLKIYEFIFQHVNITLPENFHFIDSNTPLIFEGAQGLLIDQTHGVDDLNTWTDVTSTEAFNFLEDLSSFYTYPKPVVMGLTRSYHCRHGAGEFKPGNTLNLSEPHNEYNDFQGHFRQGLLYEPYTAHAMNADPNVTEIVVTHLDRHNGQYLDISNNIVNDDVIHMLEKYRPVNLISRGPCWSHKSFR